MARLQTYSSREVQVAWGGVDFSGFADDSIVSIAFNTDRTTEKVGADGIVTTSVTADRSGTVTCNFMQGSPTHILLSKIIGDEDANGILYVADFEVSAPDGMTYIAEGCHIKTAPENMKGSEAESYTWVFFSDNIKSTGDPLGLTAIDQLKSLQDAQLVTLSRATQILQEFL